MITRKLLTNIENCDIPMNNNKVLTEVLKKLFISIEGAEIPVLHKGIEMIELPCFDGCVKDIKPKFSSNKVDGGGKKFEG